MIRPYTPEDNGQLLEILRLNTPAFFHPEEEADFVDYLKNHVQYYFVVEDAGVIIGAGGFNTGFDNGKTVRISWDIIHPDFQGKGIGTQLTLYRINQIKKSPIVNKVVVRTTQLVYEFYQKIGFELEKTEKDFWAKGFDLYQMKLDLNKSSAHKG
ncbi:MAG: GNAT family N-acetyltransferase [Bacteroidetes bacterium]|nr:GNAT family N-acetyltransferase [Bacteroidota bacterium]